MGRENVSENPEDLVDSHPTPQTENKTKMIHDMGSWKGMVFPFNPTENPRYELERIVGRWLCFWWYRNEEPPSKSLTLRTTEPINPWKEPYMCSLGILPPNKIVWWLEERSKCRTHGSHFLSVDRDEAMGKLKVTNQELHIILPFSSFELGSFVIWAYVYQIDHLPISNIWYATKGLLSLCFGLVQLLRLVFNDNPKIQTMIVRQY